MSRNLLVAIGVLILIVLAAGFFYLQGDTTTQSPSPTPTPAMPSEVSPSPEATASPSGEVLMEDEETAVSVTQNGFNPQTINVTAGSKVTWTNDSGVPSNVSSDPHPTHTLWSFLNLGTFSNGQSVSVTFDDAGTYTYHNHLTPSQKGTVIVK